jgi:hypothetical protein
MDANSEFDLIEGLSLEDAEKAQSIELSLADLDVVAGGNAIVGFY